MEAAVRQNIARLKNRVLCAGRLFLEAVVKAVPETAHHPNESRASHYGGVTVTQAVAEHTPWGHPVACIVTVIGTIEASGLPFSVQEFCEYAAVDTSSGGVYINGADGV